MMRAILATLALFAAFPAAAETIAIVHARAWTMAGSGPIENATIVARNDAIVSVAAGASPPADARVIDAAGRIVTPGLMSGATQLGLTEVGAAAETNDQTVSSGPLGASFDVQYALNANSVLLPQARADGLTRAMSYPGGAAGVPFAGLGALIRLVEGPDILERPRAALFVTVGSSTSAKAGGSRAAQWALLRNAFDEVRAYSAAPRTLAVRDQLLNRLDIAALQPVLAGRVPLVVAAQRESDIRQAVKLAKDYALRLVILGGVEAWRAADLLAATKTPVVLDPLANLPVSFDQIGARLDNAALLAKAGVPIAFSVSGNGIYLSYNAGLALREGAGFAVANGLPYADALKAITIGAARIWGIDAHYGTIAPGKDADLVIWDGDPLEPSSAPAAMFVRGRQASLVTRQTLLRDRYAPSRSNDPLPPTYR
jgi:imidazolonepropionase-like amidohydrolase